MGQRYFLIEVNESKTTEQIRYCHISISYKANDPFNEIL